MPSAAPTPVYFLALLRVTDIDRYRREYGRNVLPQLAAAGARILVASTAPAVLEEEWEATWTVVIEFPDRAAALRWYQSEAYAPLKTLRLEELTRGGAAALFEAYQPQAGSTDPHLSR
jgi:uncharacterized protein (DUF1330 family)